MLVKMLVSSRKLCFGVIAASSFLLILSGCMMKKIKQETGLRQVSLVELISMPERHNGEKVEVKGYLLNGYLYLNRDNAKITRDISMAIHIMEPSENTELTRKCNDAYATVIGLFRSTGSIWKAGRGTIDPVNTVVLYKPSEKKCWQSNFQLEINFSFSMLDDFYVRDLFLLSISSFTV